MEAFLNAGAVRVAVWPTHCETEQAMGEQLERMAGVDPVALCTNHQSYGGR